MNNQRSRDNVKQLRNKYPKDTIVELISMNDPQAPPIGTRGAVSCIDDMGTIHVNWESGSSLGLISGVDQFKVIKKGDE